MTFHQNDSNELVDYFVLGSEMASKFVEKKVLLIMFFPAQLQNHLAIFSFLPSTSSSKMSLELLLPMSKIGT